MSKMKNVMGSFFSIYILTRRTFNLLDSPTCKLMVSMQNLASMIFPSVTIAPCFMYVAVVGRTRKAKATAGTGN